jgi:hypothetical protein
MQLYRYFVSQSSEFCRHNTLCCFLMSICCLFRYRLSPETFGHTLLRFIAQYIYCRPCSRYCGIADNPLLQSQWHKCVHMLRWSRDSSVSIVTELRAGQLVFGCWRGQEFFSLPHRIHTGCGSHPASYSAGIGGMCPQV